MSLVFFAVLFGVVQLAAGIVIGCCLPLRGGRCGSGEAQHLRNLARRLGDVIAEVAGDVDEHQSRIQQVTQQLADADSDASGELAEVILRSVSTVVQLNEQLQARLTDAEQMLQQQAGQIQTHSDEARTDQLTKLPNRRAFDDKLAELIARWRRKRVAFALILIDVDHFKQFNDQMGHPAGDRVLQQIARSFVRSVRQRDLVARVGGEEFAILIPDSSVQAGCRSAERIRSRIEASPLVRRGEDVRVTVSLGVATMATADIGTTLIAHADAALYASKSAGRNCTHLYASDGCRRIDHTGDPLPGDPENAALPGAIDEEEMAVVCEDLRRRLSEITEEAGHH